MPSLQTALPPEIANNAIRLYREFLRHAKYTGPEEERMQTYLVPLTISMYKSDSPLLVTAVRSFFKRFMHETDPNTIQKLKDEAVRRLEQLKIEEAIRLGQIKLEDSRRLEWLKLEDARRLNDSNVCAKALDFYQSLVSLCYAPVAFH